MAVEAGAEDVRLGVNEEEEEAEAGSDVRPEGRLYEVWASAPGSLMI